jgi:transcriptional regulator with XRE-family HTH domain
MASAGELLRSAREIAGMSQAAVARRAGTSQATLSAYEHGRKDPRAATLLRLLAACGVRVSLEPPPATIREHLRSTGWQRTGPVPTAAHAASRILSGTDGWVAVRELIDTINLLVAVGDLAGVADLLADEPPPTGSPRFDALLAGLVEHVAQAHDLDRPPWTTDPRRFLEEWWFPHRRAFDALALRDSPAAFRRRGVFLHPSTLERV